MTRFGDMESAVRVNKVGVWKYILSLFEDAREARCPVRWDAFKNKKKEKSGCLLRYLRYTGS